MEDQPTTGSDPVDAGAQAQPDDQGQQQPAAQSPAEPITSNDNPEPSTDENLSWLSSKGVDPNSPEALAKVAEMYRNAEKAMHNSTAKAASLEQTLSQPAPDAGTDQDDLTGMLLEKVQSLELASNVNNWLSAGGDTELAAERKALEPLMAAKIAERTDLGQLVKGGYLSYDELAALTKGSDPNYGDKLKQDGGREALEQVASKQQARAVPGVATTSAVSGGVTRENFDSWYAGLTPTQRNDPANQQIVSSMLS